MKSTTPTKKINSKIFIIVATVILIAIIATANFTIFNKPVSNIGSSNASAAEPADINSDNKVDVFDLSILLSKWNTNDINSDLNKDGTTNVFDLSMLLSKWGSVITEPPASSGVYGPAFNMDTLANMQVGGNSSSSAPNVLVAYRFRAEQSSTLTDFRAFWLGTQYAPGYAGGTGGTIRITVEGDTNGVPSGNPMASYDYKPGASPLFPLLTFSSPPTLTAGKLYHLVFTNIDPAPRENFVSVDLTYVFGDKLTPRQPKYSDENYAALRRWPTTAWAVQEGYTPIIDLTYGNGAHQGQGYTGVEVNNYAPIDGATNLVRERFTVSGGDRNISDVAVRIAKISGPGALKIKLENSSGTLLSSATAQTSSVPVLPSKDNSAGVWVYGKFDAAQTIKNGQTYNIVLSTDNGTSLWTRPIQKGVADGFDKSTYFKDGRLEISDNSGATWQSWVLRGYGDLQFYLY